MLLLAVATVEGVAAESSAEPWRGLLLDWALLLPAVSLTGWMGRRLARQLRTQHLEARSLPPVGLACLVGLALLPALTEFLRWHLFGDSQPLEIAALAALRNLSLGLATLTIWRAALRCALAASAAMLLFAAILAVGQWVRWPILGFGLLACLWLILAYWRRLEGVEAARRFPVGVVAALLLLVSGIVAVVAVGPDRVPQALAAWLPSSGGDQGAAANSRGGVGDGEEVMKARHAPRSVGITDSDLMLETEQPSLYDLVGEQYGPPIRTRQQEQAQSLQGKKLKQDFAVAENYKVSREFPLHRQPPTVKDQESQLADALLYVKGRVPQHLRLQAFAQFDGAAWQPWEPDVAALQLRQEEGSHWFELEHQPAAPNEASDDQVSVKITKLGGNVLPLPGRVVRFRLGKLSQTRFFARTQGDLICLAERDLPTGVAVDACFRTVDWEAMASLPLPPFASAFLAFQRLPEGWPERERIAQLAKDWTRDQPAGWPQVQAIVRKLREEYQLDRAYRPPVACPDALADFLFQSKRGPDYQFASAAALLLRALGYPTRLVAGFYADPKNFDEKSGHTLIQRDDVHTWLEVMGPGRQWLTLEPSPGYAVIEPVFPWYERLSRWLATLWKWIAARPLASAAAAVLLAALILLRYRLLDAVATLAWSCFPARDWRRRTLATLRLIEQRARWGGRARPRGTSPGRWYRGIAPEAAEWLNLAEVALYASDRKAAPLPGPEVRSQCRRAAGLFTLGRFRRAAGIPISK